MSTKFSHLIFKAICVAISAFFTALLSVQFLISLLDRMSMPFVHLIEVANYMFSIQNSSCSRLLFQWWTRFKLSLVMWNQLQSPTLLGYLGVCVCIFVFPFINNSHNILGIMRTKSDELSKHACCFIFFSFSYFLK